MHGILVSPHHQKHREVSQMDQTPSQIRNGELAEWRMKVAGDLEMLADCLRATSHDEFPTPQLHIGVWSIETPTDDDIYACPGVTQEHVRKAMAALPGEWHKYAGQDTITYSKAFGDTIRMAFYVNRSTTCRRVQTGTKTVEATEAHDEPVYEWRCDTPELEV